MSNEDKCRFQCKELIGKGICNKESMWNLSSCECKSCDIEEYLDCKNCKSRNEIVAKLVDECSENADGEENTQIHIL